MQIDILGHICYKAFLIILAKTFINVIQASTITIHFIAILIVSSSRTHQIHIPSSLQQLLHAFLLDLESPDTHFSILQTENYQVTSRFRKFSIRTHYYIGTAHNCSKPTLQLSSCMLQSQDSECIILTATTKPSLFHFTLFVLDDN